MYKVEKTTDDRIELVKVPQGSNPQQMNDDDEEDDLPSAVLFSRSLSYYEAWLNKPESYQTLPQDKPYWLSKVGELVGEGEFAISDIGYGEIAIPKINGRGEFNAKPETSLIWDGVYAGACPKCNKYPFVSGCKTESGSYHASQFCQCPDTSIYAIPPSNDSRVPQAALNAVRELLIKHRSVFDGLDIPSEDTKALLLHFNYSTQY